MFKLYLCAILLPFVAFGQSVDPTRPLIGASTNSSKTVQKNELILQSIISGNEDKRVIINGKLLKEGQRINQYTLLKINDNNVMLSSSEKQLKLSLYQQVIAPVNRKSP